MTVIGITTDGFTRAVETTSVGATTDGFTGAAETTSNTSQLKSGAQIHSAVIYAILAPSASLK